MMIACLGCSLQLPQLPTSTIPILGEGFTQDHWDYALETLSPLAFAAEPILPHGLWQHVLSLSMLVS
eukprot:4897486-Amphidinium_carterae.1